MAKSNKKYQTFGAHSRQLYKRLWRDYAHKQLRFVLLTLLCMVFVAGANAAQVFLIKDIVAEILDKKNAALLAPIALATTTIFLVIGVGSYLQNILMSHIGLRVVTDVQLHMHRRLLSFDLEFFNRTSPGTLLTRFLSDVMMLQSTVTTITTGIGLDAMKVIGLAFTVFYMDWQLAAAAFLLFPLVIAPVAKIGQKMRKLTGRTQEQRALLTTLLDETFQGARQVKAYAMEEHESERARFRMERVFKLAMKGARTRNLVRPAMEIVAGLAVAAIIMYGGNRVITGELTPDVLIAFIFALISLYRPLKSLARINTTLQEGLAAMERVFDLMDQKPQIQDKPDARPIAIGKGEVVLKELSFSYSNGGVAALNSVNITAKPGETIALVGASGAGKTTVLNLIPRFYDANEGQVLIDGQDVRNVTLQSLRKSIGIVSQEVLLFDDTVRNNILYGKMNATQQELEEAARMAGAHDFICDLPDGYDTEVGPRGAKLSGGQRQRISIARAMLRNAPILLLDEATSALDTETEKKVQIALERLMKNRTTFVIAHRLSTIIHADRIYVMEAGRVIEEGTHKELLDQKGTYARLHAIQFKEELDMQSVFNDSATPLEA